MSVPVNSNGGFDFSGKLIIKAKLGDDIRRIPIHNEDMTYDELILMMQRVFRNTLSPDDEISIKYKDEDGDLVTIFDSSDLAFAIQCSRVLKLTILVGGKQDNNSNNLQLHSTADLRKELRNIRDHVVSLIDGLDKVADSCQRSRNITQQAEEMEMSSSLNSQSTQPSVNAAPKEFDPLQAQQSTGSTPTHGPPSTEGIKEEKVSENPAKLESNTPSESSTPTPYTQPVQQQTSSHQPQMNYAAYTQASPGPSSYPQYQGPNQGPMIAQPTTPSQTVPTSAPQGPQQFFQPQYQQFPGYASYYPPAAGGGPRPSSMRAPPPPQGIPGTQGGPSTAATGPIHRFPGQPMPGNIYTWQ